MPAISGRVRRGEAVQTDKDIPASVARRISLEAPGRARFAMALSTRCWLALFLASVGAPCCSSQGTSRASDAAFALTWASQPAFANETVLLWGGA
eukprot:COSAG03_NODE_26_length_19032_cov_87.110812_20_plen_95_part_00